MLQEIVREKAAKLKKETIKSVWIFGAMIIFLFLSPWISQKRSSNKIITLPDAKSIPSAGFKAS